MEDSLRKRKRRVQMTKKRVATYTSFAIILVFPAAGLTSDLICVTMIRKVPS